MDVRCTNGTAPNIEGTWVTRLTVISRGVGRTDRIEADPPQTGMTVTERRIRIRALRCVHEDPVIGHQGHQPHLEFTKIAAN